MKISVQAERLARPESKDKTHFLLLPLFVLERFGEHLRSISKSAPGFPVAEHFSSNGHTIADALVRWDQTLRWEQTEEEAGNASYLSTRDVPAARPQR